ncbi:MAG: NAD+ kinase [Lysobacterales bacterium]
MSGKIRFVASPVPAAQKALELMKAQYGQSDLDSAEIIVALGGDGFMLRTLHHLIDSGLPVYGMKLGNVGFLMNRYVEEDLKQRLNDANMVELNPLRMKCRCVDGEVFSALAINEVSLVRQTNQAAHIQILVNDLIKVEALVCDGVLVSTAAGSTAYNLSAHGPILPLGTDALALTPISPFRPRRWKGAILPVTARIKLEVIDAQDRSVSATADYNEFRNVKSVEVFEDRSTTLKLMFDPDHSLEERILNEQFL